MPIDLIDTIKPKNNGTFPMVEAEDVVVGKGTADEKRLPEALAEAGKVAAVDTAMPSSPADDHVPSTQLLKEQLDGKLSLTGGTVTGNVTFNGTDNYMTSLRFGGTAVAAGLKTRGICGWNVQNQKNGLFLNYDGRDVPTEEYFSAGEKRGVYICGGLDTTNQTCLVLRKMDGDYFYAPKATTYTKEDVDAALAKKLSLTGGTVTGEVILNGGIRAKEIRSISSGTLYYDIVDGKGARFSNVFQLLGYGGGAGSGNPVFEQTTPTTNWIDVTTLKEGGTPLADKYAAKSHQHAASDITGLPSGIDVDDALSNTSENPVQNKVVKVALDGKLSTTNPKLAMDSGLTFSSGNISTGTIHYATLALTESGTLVFIASNSAQYKNATLPLSAKSFSAETSFTIYGVEGAPKTQLTSDYILEAGKKLQDKYAAKEHTHTEYLSSSGGTIAGDLAVSGTLSPTTIKLKDEFGRETEISSSHIKCGTGAGLIETADLNAGSIRHFTTLIASESGAYIGAYVNEGVEYFARIDGEGIKQKVGDEFKLLSDIYATKEYVTELVGDIQAALAAI